MFIFIQQNSVMMDLQEKVIRLTQQIYPFYHKEIQVFHSPTTHYRMRAEFRIWRDERQILHYAMCPKGEKLNAQNVIFIEQFEIANPQINALMPLLLQKVNSCEILGKGLFQVEFLSTTQGQILVSLIYHRFLGEDWVECAKCLEEELGIHIIGRSRKQTCVISQEFVEEKLMIDGQQTWYRQYENGFTQPNALMNQAMIEWVIEHVRNLSGDLLELYCGNGNFTIPISRYVSKVLATEISKRSIHALKENVEMNHCHNIQVARLSAQEFTQAWTKVRSFKRLQEACIELDHYQIKTILVDPPRAGIDPETLKLMQTFDHIIYVSCNPNTLMENLHTLCQTHQVVNCAVFDQFPNTEHVETIVLMQRVES